MGSPSTGNPRTQLGIPDMCDYEKQYTYAANALQPEKQMREISVGRLYLVLKNQKDPQERMKQKRDINNND